MNMNITVGHSIFVCCLSYANIYSLISKRRWLLFDDHLELIQTWWL